MLIKGTHLIKLDPGEPDFRFQVDTKLSHFNTREFRCKCCKVLLIDYRLVVALEKLRLDLALPLTITSGYRCIAHNKAEGGVKRSGHTKGYSADVATPQGMDTLRGALQWLPRQAWLLPHWNKKTPMGPRQMGKLLNIALAGSLPILPA